MPLRVINGKDIVAAPALAAFALGGATTVANIPWLKQEQTQWCWATAMQMVFQKYDDLTIQQCDLSNAAFGNTGCCTTPSSSLCNQPLPVIRISPEWGKYSFSAVFVNGSIEFSDLQNDINNDCPVEIGFKWRGGGGHAVLAVGWDIIDSVPQVFIHDPWRGNLTIPYEKVKAAYGEGDWKWSWRNIKK